MRRAFIVTFAIVLNLCVAATSSAQTVAADAREDLQFWNETQVIMRTNERIDLMLFGVLRMGRDLARPGAISSDVRHQWDLFNFAVIEITSPDFTLSQAPFGESFEYQVWYPSFTILN